MKLKVEMANQKGGKQRVMLESGELLEGVKEIKWSARASENPVLILEMFPSKVIFDTAGGESPVKL